MKKKKIIFYRRRVAGTAVTHACVALPCLFFAFIREIRVKIPWQAN
jgi:hypothetical protein